MAMHSESLLAIQRLAPKSLSTTLAPASPAHHNTFQPAHLMAAIGGGTRTQTHAPILHHRPSACRPRPPPTPRQHATATARPSAPTAGGTQTTIRTEHLATPPTAGIPTTETTGRRAPRPAQATARTPHPTPMALQVHS